MQKQFWWFAIDFCFNLSEIYCDKHYYLQYWKNWNINTYFPVKHISIETFNNDAIDREFIKIGQMMKPWLINMLRTDKIFCSSSIFFSIMNIHHNVLTYFTLRRKIGDLIKWFRKNEITNGYSYDRTMTHFIVNLFY